MVRELKIHLEKELNGVGSVHHIIAYCGYTTWESMHMTGGNWVDRRDLKGGLNFTKNPTEVTCESCKKFIKRAKKLSSLPGNVDYVGV